MIKVPQLYVLHRENGGQPSVEILGVFRTQADARHRAGEVHKDQLTWEDDSAGKGPWYAQPHASDWHSYGITRFDVSHLLLYTDDN